MTRSSTCQSHGSHPWGLACKICKHIHTEYTDIIRYIHSTVEICRESVEFCRVFHCEAEKKEELCLKQSEDIWRVCCVNRSSWYVMVCQASNLWFSTFFNHITHINAASMHIKHPFAMDRTWFVLPIDSTAPSLPGTKVKREDTSLRCSHEYRDIVIVFPSWPKWRLFMFILWKTTITVWSLAAPPWYHSGFWWELAALGVFGRRTRGRLHLAGHHFFWTHAPCP